MIIRLPLGKSRRRAEEARRLCDRLLEDGREGAAAQSAAELLQALEAMDAAESLDFYRMLATDYGPPAEALSAAARAYLAQPGETTASALTEAAEPRRQDVLRRLNMAPGATGAIVAMRSEVLKLVRDHPELKPLAADLRHLLASWFNRGFLRLEQMSWRAPAAVLEKLIAYEAVHEIAGWDDLRRRLDDRDRRCFAFFHPALPEEPIIFVEVALTDEISGDIDRLLSPEVGRRAKTPKTAIFYSISNCQPGLRGISFGDLLIKQVVAELRAEFPSLKVFATLSPIPGFRRWLDKALDAGFAPQELRPLLAEQAWPALQKPLMALCAAYLTGVRPDGSAGPPSDPVSRFHLANGARLERLDWMADRSAKGMKESLGLMVNYRYLPRDIEANHDAFAQEERVVRSRKIDALAAAAIKKNPLLRTG